MRFFTPDKNRKLLSFQLIVICCFAFSLYFYLSSRQEEKAIKQGLDQLLSQRIQLKQTVKDVAAYDTLLSTDSTLANLSPELNWEQMDFSWTSLSLEELLLRIDTLSHKQKIFVLESFEADLKSSGSESGSIGSENTNNVSSPEFGERIFRMRGYFLCPYL
jgi:hypothetical protein